MMGSRLMAAAISSTPFLGVRSAALAAASPPRNRVSKRGDIHVLISPQGVSLTLCAHVNKRGACTDLRLTDNLSLFVSH